MKRRSWIKEIREALNLLRDTKYSRSTKIEKLRELQTEIEDHITEIESGEME